MFETITPEQAGISSECIVKFIHSLERKGLVFHSFLMMKGNNIFAEYYWKPFNKNFCHRMYSQTKSFVSVAIGLLEEDGKLSLNDKIVKYFPEKTERPIPQYLANMTIKEMLTMETCGETPYWFEHTAIDRTQLYFSENSSTIPAGMRWKYDSPGSQVLSNLVEKLSGTTLFEFLYDRIFKHLGTFNNATILKTRNNDSFGDSAMLCTTRDLASFARFVMNYGTWNGKRLMNEAYLKTATSKIVDNNISGFDDASSQGYGYQIWRTHDNGFAFCGMGGQLSICLPEKDFIFVCTGDNQGYQDGMLPIQNTLFDIIIDNLHDGPLNENPAAYNDALALSEELKLFAIKGKSYSDYSKILSGKKYICEKNPTGITEFSLKFNSDNTGEFIYKNEQGNKTLTFGICRNIFSKFPQFGYSDDHAGMPADDKNFLYDCAASAAWREDKKLLLKVQIIDKYFGNMLTVFSFKDDYATVTMIKNAENFLNEYEGEFVAKLQK